MEIYCADVDKCAFAQLEYGETIDLEQMLNCLRLFNKSVLWNEPPCPGGHSDSDTAEIVKHSMTHQND